MRLLLSDSVLWLRAMLHCIRCPLESRFESVELINGLEHHVHRLQRTVCRSILSLQ
jgi:hypothetical protein